jgi:hypothetical protein
VTSNSGKLHFSIVLTPASSSIISNLKRCVCTEAGGL